MKVSSVKEMGKEEGRGKRHWCAKDKDKESG